MEKLGGRLAEIYGHQKWVIATQAAVAAGEIVRHLADWGSTAILVASNQGTGEAPDVETLYTHSTGHGAVDSIRRFFESVEDPSAEILGGVDRFDPDHEARVIAEPYATAQRMLGRPTFGVRRPNWSAWEDKMRVDRLWEELGIRHAPYRIVSVAEAGGAADALAGRLGTVWVADNSEGWHGGGDYLRWVTGPDRYGEAIAWLANRARQVRVMPFLDGLPCSIHGWVTASGVATFLPVEINILRDTSEHRLVYAGVSTMWDAPDARVTEMRAIAVKVGLALGDREGYRGPFGIDGVLTADGFLPTELNPRMSAGAGIQLAGLDLPLGMVMRAEIEDLLQVDPEWLEETALAGRRRRIHFGRMVSEEVRGSVLVGLDEAGDVVEVPGNEGAIGEMTAGPSATGSYITARLDPQQLIPGPPSGPLVAGLLNLAARKWDLDTGRLSASPYPLETAPEEPPV